MRLLRFVPMFVFSLILSGGQTILIVDQADARPCNPYRYPPEPPPPCTQGFYMVHGSVQQINHKGNKFRIRVNKESYWDVKASQDVVHVFKGEEIGEKEVPGFGILTKKGKHIELAAFVADSPNLSNEDITQSVSEIIERFNQQFEKFVQNINLSHQK